MACTTAYALMAIVEHGRLKGPFRGFNNPWTVFEFADGGKWRQKEYKYVHHYALMPSAKVIRHAGRYTMYVEGVNAQVEVIPLDW